MGVIARFVSGMRAPAGRQRLVLLSVLLFSGTSSAYYLDAEHRFDVRVRAYSQLSLLTEDSETPSRADIARALTFVPADAPRAQKRAQIGVITPPKYDAFDLAQHRNFYNPEFAGRDGGKSRGSRRVDRGPCLALRASAYARARERARAAEPPVARQRAKRQAAARLAWR